LESSEGEITPTIAAISDVRSVVDVIADNIRGLSAGQPCAAGWI